jgi:hypothetical protein
MDETFFEPDEPRHLAEARASWEFDESSAEEETEA